MSSINELEKRINNLNADLKGTRDAGKRVQIVGEINKLNMELISLRNAPVEEKKVVNVPVEEKKVVENASVKKEEVKVDDIKPDINRGKVSEVSSSESTVEEKVEEKKEYNKNQQHNDNKKK